MTQAAIYTVDHATQARIEAWQSEPFDSATREEVAKILRDDPTALVDAFYARLSFGTGGMRGLMGVGTNRINGYTLAFATEGLARYLSGYFENEKELKVFIGYDCRHKSEEFARIAATVLAGHGIHVFISDEIVTTPFTSFATRELGCHAAIMITASHNPKEYNGFKVYFQDGAQIISPHDAGIEREARDVTSPDQVKRAPLNSPCIHFIDEALKQKYSDGLRKCQLLREKTLEEGSKLKIVFANLHGTGSSFIPDLMQDSGFTNFHSVLEQEIADGSFPTVLFPNPEDPEALHLGIKKLKAINGDILIATDPDADRMRACIRVGEDISLLNGNQIACLLLFHILSNLKKSGALPKNGAVVKTIVTTELFRKIAESFDVECVDVLTGFKFIGERIHAWEDGSKTYLFGGEESYGTLMGTLARDKDGVQASLLIAEAALSAKLEGKSLLDILNNLFQTFGHYSQGVLSLNYPESLEGHQQMKGIMERLREHPPLTLRGNKVQSIEDFLKGKKRDLKTDLEEPLHFPPSNVLVFRLIDGSSIIIRPSGTEPKIKIYGEVIGSEAYCSTLLASFSDYLNTL